MAKYLHLYDNRQDFSDEYYNDETYYEPWVSLTKSTDEVDYNKKIDYEILN